MNRRDFFKRAAVTMLAGPANVMLVGKPIRLPLRSTEGPSRCSPDDAATART